MEPKTLHYICSSVDRVDIRPKSTRSTLLVYSMKEAPGSAGQKTFRFGRWPSETNFTLLNTFGTLPHQSQSQFRWPARLEVPGPVTMAVARGLRGAVVSLRGVWEVWFWA